MRKLLTLVVVAAAVAGCAPKSEDADDGRLTVVASFFPLADAARAIGGDKVRVRDLTPAGVEPHDYELTSDDVDAIEDADLVVYVKNGFQPAVEKAAERRDGPTLALGHEAHFWLQPALMAAAVERLGAELVKLVPSVNNEAERYTQAIGNLAVEYKLALANCVRRDIVTVHAAFKGLAAAYGFNEHSITGASPEADAGPARIAELAELIRARAIPVVFYEPLAPKQLAATVADAAGVATAVLDPVEGGDSDDSYVSLMTENLAALKNAMGCR